MKLKMGGLCIMSDRISCYTSVYESSTEEDIDPYVYVRIAELPEGVEREAISKAIIETEIDYIKEWMRNSEAEIIMKVFITDGGEDKIIDEMTIERTIYAP